MQGLAVQQTRTLVIILQLLIGWAERCPPPRVSESAPGDLYQTLGLKSDATDKDIRSAFRILSLRFHPDKDLKNPHSNKRYRRILHAYQILSSPRFRKVYDDGGDEMLQNARLKIREESNRPVGDKIYAEMYWDADEIPNEKMVGRLDYVAFDDFIHIHGIWMSRSLEWMPGLHVDAVMFKHLSHRYPGSWIHQVFIPSNYDGHDHHALIESWRRCRRWAKTHGFELMVLAPSAQKEGEGEEMPVDLDDERNVPPPYTTMCFRATKIDEHRRRGLDAPRKNTILIRTRNDSTLDNADSSSSGDDQTPKDDGNKPNTGASVASVSDFFQTLAL
mmetsp:Transcript_2612/g.3615  ORF Transcript_2612/g.3615 Transcript_2612/m.3615 type:complete len:332 (+) Transcript_2612:143-1138(+)